jgi:hypothetical protein
MQRGYWRRISNESKNGADWLMEGPARVLLAKAYYPYTSNQRPASHARALSGATASISDPALSVSLRSSLGSGCARTASPRAARLLHVPVRWAAQDGGCRKKAHYPGLGTTHKAWSMVWLPGLNNV